MKMVRAWGVACLVLGLSGVAGAVPGSCDADASQALAREPRDVAEWIARMHHASLYQNYSGTFVVLSGNGSMVSSRIWHVCEGGQQIERVESLSGTPRVVFRKEGEMRTFLPQARLVRSEMREVPGVFPRVSDAKGVRPERHYVLQSIGRERVAGLDADKLSFQPQDSWRFGYRIWVDRTSGLIIKMQTLDAEGRLLEQAAFSELNLTVPFRLEPMARMMDDLQGYRLVAVPVQRTTVEAEGWTVGEAVAGFVPQGCYRKGAPAGHLLQCIYSDGLATLSVFWESYDAARHPVSPRIASMGATQVVSQRISDGKWVTAVGEVPAQTLQRFIDSITRSN